MAKLLRRAVPNESSGMVLEFEGPEYRLFDVLILYKEKGWHRLAYPQHIKRFTVAPDAMCWTDEGSVSSAYLYQKSAPLDEESLERQVLRLGYRNQAPTSAHARHHVHEVCLARFGKKPFRIDESIGGGATGIETGCDFSIEELLLYPSWRRYFELSGCAWAVPMIETLASDPESLLDSLVTEACRCNGAPERPLPAPMPAPRDQSTSFLKRIASITSASAREFWRRLG